MARKKMKTRSDRGPPHGPPSGFIFSCDRVTKPECFRMQVFGLPSSRIESVMLIEPGTALFLFDFELRILYGVYRAASYGGANLEALAFGGKFPAQVKFQVDRDCHPLPESVFRQAIHENYSKDKFRPDLTYSQVRRLLSLFQVINVSPHPPPPVVSMDVSNNTQSMDGSPSGFIFMCDRITKPQCFQSRVFGLPMSKIDTVMRIEPGMVLFLFDCELKILYGVYRAASHGGANLVPDAFGGKFPAQVKFEVDMGCHPLPESVFKNAIPENYSKDKFRSDLTHPQVRRLLSLFQVATVSPHPPPPVVSMDVSNNAQSMDGSPSGFIFICDRMTKRECFQSEVFGLPMSKVDSVMRIEPGMMLFLFDCELKVLYGVYRAVSHGGANLVPDAFGGKFPAQVKFQIDRDCYPLTESSLRGAIRENYFKGNKFRQELDHRQVHRLLSLFQDTTVPPPLPHTRDFQSTHQIVRPPTSMDHRYVLPAAPTNQYYHAPPDAPTNQYYHAPPNDPYFHGSSRPMLHGDQFFVAPPPPTSLSNDQYYATHANYQAQAPPLPPPLNAQYNTVLPCYPTQTLQEPLNYPAGPAQLPQPTSTAPPPSHHHYHTPPNDAYYTAGYSQNNCQGTPIPV